MPLMWTKQTYSTEVWWKSESANWKVKSALDRNGRHGIMPVVRPESSQVVEDFRWSEPNKTQSTYGRRKSENAYAKGGTLDGSKWLALTVAETYSCTSPCSVITIFMILHSLSQKKSTSQLWRCNISDGKRWCGPLARLKAQLTYRL